ncbi:MAG: deoxyguanosinetriphosphate triphosphohydrolase [Gammaproteobacteria bacterium]|nr:deoxyguanosinetriphosphate triphosphohydrolase [Gammaproteobacteria bacterium]
MNWNQLLSENRLGKVNHSAEIDRTAFQKDVDRIIFSSAFRRLQDKTQVFPLAQNDYVRTRLTHTLEASSVGRSIGTLVGKHITTNYSLGRFNAEDFGSIVAAACLAHDIGNPPFGHFGEEAFRAFFSERDVGKKICETIPKEQQQDLLHFEGNAQGFRILTYLQNPDLNGGMQLTYATLGAFTKYPCTRNNYNKERIASKKNGLLTQDIPVFTNIAECLGLIQYSQNSWARHPLVYLMEAADDICYAIIDIEDAYQIKQISFEQAYSLLIPLATNINSQKLNNIQSKSDKISYLRANAIGNLIQQAVKVFILQEQSILEGSYHRAISEDIASSQELAELTKYASNHIYNCNAVVETEMAGYRIIGDLMELYCKASEDVATSQHNKNHKATAASSMLINLLPTRFIGNNRIFSSCTYQRTLKIIDYISGMTDSYAVSLYKKLTGISI